jgi:hypothetical protein
MTIIIFTINEFINADFILVTITDRFILLTLFVFTLCLGSTSLSYSAESGDYNITAIYRSVLVLLNAMFRIPLSLHNITVASMLSEPGGGG